MGKRKIIVIDETIDMHLTLICDAALKYLGMKALKDVNDLAEAVHEEQIDDSKYM